MKKIYIIIPIIIISLLTIGFSAFENSLLVDDIAVEVRVKKDIRVTAVEILETSGEAETYSLHDYNVNNINGEINLPNSSSFIKYKVTITNIGNVDEGILSISDLPSGLTYSLDGYTLKDKLCDDNDSSKCNKSSLTTFYITIRPTGNNYQGNFMTTFNFREFCKITYVGLDGSFPNEKLKGDSLQINIDSSIDGKYLSIITASGNVYTLGNEFSYSNGVLTIPNVEENITIRYRNDIWYKNCTASSKELNCKLISVETPYADNVSSTYVSSSSGINFSAAASNTNGLGLYYTADSTKTEDLNSDGIGDKVYYYRGLVTNNFVIFDSYCWRIVRINEDGTIKLIYAGTPTNGTCPANGSTNVYINSGRYNTATNDNAYLGYMYGSAGARTYAAAHANTNSSAIKSTIDSWYSENLSDSASYIADVPFCNDRKLVSGNGYGTSASVYGPEARFYTDSSNQKPQFTCSQKDDRFTVSNTFGNGKLTHPIGLLTADEASYAGTLYSKASGTNSSHYLYSNNYFWLMSPGDYENNNAYIFVINNYGYMRLLPSSSTSNTVYIRPVINLIDSVKYDGGTGTNSNPYTINITPGTIPDKPDDPITDPNWYNNCSTNSQRLNCTMINASTPNSDSSINFGAVASSSNGNGLYYTNDLTKTEDLDSDGTGERVYYYRGAVTNNYVLFGNYCWRIVRTNEDSSVKLVYGGTPSNGSCPQTGSAASIGNSSFNSTANDNAYVGYMYGTTGSNNYNSTHTNTNNSAIKTVVDNWYASNLTSYASYLADYPFCNDRSLYSGNGYGSNTASYNPYNRLFTNKNPQFLCSQTNDKFTVSNSNGNKALRYPIGLLTADEVYYAGSIQTSNTSQTTYYLYTGSGIWTMTPSDYYSANNSASAYVFYIDTNGSMRLSNNLTSSYTVRPVISLLPEVIVSSGTGAYNSPYQLSLS